jgi:hypothetical protein
MNERAESDRLGRSCRTFCHLALNPLYRQTRIPAFEGLYQRSNPGVSQSKDVCIRSNQE